MLYGDGVFAGLLSSTSVLNSPTGAASLQPSCSPPRRPSNTAFINFNLDLTSSAPFRMSPARPEALNTLHNSQAQSVDGANDMIHSSRPVSGRSYTSVDGTASTTACLGATFSVYGCTDSANNEKLCSMRVVTCMSWTDLNIESAVWEHSDASGPAHSMPITACRYTEDQQQGEALEFGTAGGYQSCSKVWLDSTRSMLYSCKICQEDCFAGSHTGVTSIKLSAISYLCYPASHHTDRVLQSTLSRTIIFM